MLPRLRVSSRRQTATRRMVVCGGCVGLSFLAIVGFGLLPRIQASENILPDRQVHAAPTRIQPKLVASCGKLPLSFEANQGQTDARVRFPAPGGGYTNFVTDDEAVLTLRKSSPGPSRLGKFGPPDPLDPFGPVGPRAGRWLAAALASPVSAGPQASTLPAPDAGQGGLVTLRGNTRPEAKATNDRGRVSDDLTINHMMLQLQRTPEQEQALQQFINDIHDPNSPLFHHWITAAEFGQTYGVAPADAARVTDWLESQGFKVNLVYPNQMVIDFTGSAGQIRQAFHTEIHNLLVNGQAHIANMSDPQIPTELGSTVAGVVSLNDFRPHPTLQPRANYNAGSGEYLVVPADLATIYNFNPAFAAGYSGQGQTIVLIEDTDLYTTADWNTFRSVMGLASAYPSGSLAQVHPPSSPTNNCTDPGHNGDDGEAAIDVEWASAGAPSAAIELASCSEGLFVALQNLLNASGTPPAIVSISYGASESELGAAYNAYTNSLYQQAVTEGVSIFVSSGDEGAASSDYGQAYAVHGITVSGLTSTPYNVSVGGTDFADTYQGTNATYWNTTNAANYGSALSYVPEIPWNDSCASVLIGDKLGVLPTYGSSGLCNNANDVDKYGLLNTAAGSGGPSGCATGAPDSGGVVGGTCAGYAKPSWQSGLIGNPSDGVRDIPDVSLFAANGIWGHYYVVCFSDPNNGGASCSGAPSTWAGFGGTSVSSPIMAAIQSLINQASGSRWGNPNPAYYALAATEYGSGGSTSCNSPLGNTVATNCIFYDVTPIRLLYEGSGAGGDNDVPCSGMNCYLPSGTDGVLSTAPQTLSSVLVTNLGSGYTSAPSCTLSGGGGSGATCSASVGIGVVSSLTLTNGGSGYTSIPTCTLTGGGGTGATCGTSISDTKAVEAVFLSNNGSGYRSAPTCKISGGGGSGATCSATQATGIAVRLTAPGSGYTTLPHCVLSGGGGTGGTCAALAVNTSDTYQPAFGTATGWDFATGIGTVNASNLVASFVSSSATLSPLSLAFPPQAIYTSSAAQSVRVTNTGTANLTILTVTMGGTNASDFAKSADTCTGATLIPNGTCTVSVTFTPTAAGSLSALLIFTDIAPHSPQTVSLSGTGTAPLVITASSASMTYGGTPPTITPSYSGFVNGDTASSLTTQPTCSTTATAHSPVGSYPSSCSGAVDPNYSFTYVPGNVTVGKASLTITASSTSMTYGGTAPAVTPIYSAFAGSDTVNSLTTAPTCTTTVTSSSPVG
ncbi:MAG: protease pro-enzyme activation domain-containing protein, partial [Terriglobia bacterium]